MATFTLGPLTFSGPNLASANNVVTGTGVDVGFTPVGTEAFKPLFSAPGTVSFTQGSITPTFSIDGDVIANVPVINKSFTILTGHHDFDVSALVNSKLAELDGKAITVAGATFTLGSVRLESPSSTNTSAARIDLQGSLVIPQLAGLTLTVDGANQVIIDTSTGVTLSGLSASITAPFTAFGVTITPSPNVQVDYTSATETFAISGGVTVATSGNTIAASLGTPAAPGLQVVSGNVTAVNFGVTTDFTLFGLSVHPTALTFAYDAKNAQYALSGGIVFNTSTNSITASLGTQAAPGIVIQNGAITSVNAGITANFNLFGVAIQPNGLSLAYDAKNSQYGVYGGLTVSTSGNTITADLGTQAAPGLLIQNGAISTVNFGLTGNFTLFGATIQPNGLTFSYDSKNAQYAIYGGLKVTASGNTIDATLGTQAAPGLVIQSGAITSVNAGITGSFTLFGLTIQPNGLSLAYDAKNSQYEVYGGLTVATSGNTITADLGTQAAPGLLIQNGVISTVTFGLTGNFTLFGATIQPNGLTFSYDSKASQYEIYGGLKLITSGNTIDATLGTQAAPGLVIQSGAITAVNASITANFNLFGIAIQPSGLTFTYDSKNSQFAVFGGLAISSSGNTINATLGTQAAPGLLIQSGSITAVNASITGNFTLFGATIQPNGLTFSYDSKASQYEIYGGLKVVASGNTINATLGTQAAPGLVIQNGVISTVTFGLTGNFTLFGATIQPNGLTFNYDSKNAQYALYGGLKVIASGNTINATLGTQAAPGLVIQNGSITAVNASITASFTLFGITIQPNGLTFAYDSKNSQFEVYGNLAFSSSGNTINASLGTQSAPGLLIQNGAITSVNMGVTGKFNLFGLAIQPTNLTVTYDAKNSQYAIFGGLSVSTSNQSIAASLGTAQQPGLVIKSGAVQSVNLGLTADLNLFGVTIAAQGLTFTYDAKASQYEIFGSTSATFGTNTVNVSLGDSKTPGLVIKSGSLTNLNMGVTANFTLFGVTIKPTNLTFSYDAAHSQYEIYGSLAVLASSQSITADLGTATTPGLVIQNGVVQNVNFGVTANISLFGVTIQPTGLTFVYDAKASQYAMYGSLTVIASGQSITANLGTAAQPGLVIKNGAITGVNMGVTANLSLFGVTIQPNNLTFVYDSKASRYEIYGGLTVMASGQSIAATLGTAAQPGLVIQNGTITGVNMSVTANLSLFGLTLAPTNLTFVYDAANSQYEIYGALTVSVSGQTVTANLGTQALPGLVIKNGAITNVNMGVSSDLDISGLKIHAVNLGVIYAAANHSYGLYGSITVTNVFSASASFGTPQAPGITITNGKFVVSNLQLSLSDVNLGAFALKNLSVSYKTDAQNNVTFEAAATVGLPGGVNVGGSLKFINGQIDSIALLVTGAKIPVGNTGVYIDSIGGSVTGLSSGPSFDQLQVSGYASLYYGASLSIGSDTAQLLRVDGSITINKTSLNITVGVYLGAISTGTTKNVGYGLNVPNYNGLIASGTGTLNVNWSTGVVAVSAHVSLLAGAVTLDGAIVLDGPSLSVGIRASASVQIPGGVPVIGGVSLGSGNFALVYNGTTKTGYAAAWGTYTLSIGGGRHCLWDNHGCVTLPSISTSFSGGVKFTIGSNSLSFLHGSDLTDLDNATKVIFNGHIPGVNLVGQNLLAGTSALILPHPEVQPNGSATATNQAFSLTSGGKNQSGSVYTIEEQAYANGFDSTFQFSLSPNSEGVAFVVQSQGADALGGQGALLGFDGAIGQGIAVKFDSHNDSSTDDPNGNFVTLNVAGSAAINSITSNRAPGVNLADGKLHTAEVKFTPSTNGNGWGTLTVLLDGSQPVLTAVVSLASYLGMDSGGDGSRAYFGFSSATGSDVTGTAVVSNWSLTNVTDLPAPNPTAYPGFSDATNLSFAGASALNGDNVDLTPKTATNTAGALWTQAPLDLSGGFQETIQVRTTPGGTGGFALVFQNDFAGNSAVGAAGAGLGVDGLSKAVAVGFANSANPNESALGNQSVAVYTSPDGVVRPDAAHLAAETTGLPITLNDGQVHTLVVQFDPTDNNRLSIYMEGSLDPVLSVTGIDLAAALGGTTGYVGFTGGSGNSGQTTELVDWFHVAGVAMLPAPPQAPPPPLRGASLLGSGIAGTVRVPSGASELVAVTTPVSIPLPAAPVATVPIAPSETPAIVPATLPAQTVPAPTFIAPTPLGGHGAKTVRGHGLAHHAKSPALHPHGPKGLAPHTPPRYSHSTLSNHR